MAPQRRGTAVGGGDALLEREDLLREISERATSASAGRGSLVAVVGGPGEGKSALMNEAAVLGAERGLQVWRAFGSSLEGAFGFGVVRQLLAPAVMALPSSRRAFSGAASLGASVLEVDPASEPLPPFAAQHGLYWLLAALAGMAPMMLLVDDVHWADRPSVQWMVSLRRRLDELPVLLVLATRPPAFDGRGDAVAGLLAEPALPVLRVGPLQPGSVAELTRRELGADPDRPFSEACHRATGGNPLAVVELLRELRRSGATPNTTGSARLADRAPDGIARHVLGRLDRLGSDAVQLARALAVLGDRAELRQVALLAEVDLERAGLLCDELIAAGILAGTDQLAFEHPLVHAAVRDAMTARRRARLHARAAALLAHDGADAESIAAHTMRADPAGDPDSVARLRNAAASALGRGAPDNAVSYLERALAEPPSVKLRDEVLFELGRAAWTAFDLAGLERVESAREMITGPSMRARLDLMLAELCFYAGRRDRLFAVLERGLSDLEGRDPVLAFELRAMRTTALAALDSGWPAADDSAHGRLVSVDGAAGTTARQLMLSLAMAGNWTGRRTAPETIALVNGALDEALLERLDAGSMTRVAHGLFALIFADELERVADLSGRLLTSAVADGVPLRVGLSAHAHGWAQLRRGMLADAEASARLSFETAVATEARFAEGITRSPLAEVLVERGRLDEAEELLGGVSPGVDSLSTQIFVGTARVRLHLARAARDLAIAELKELQALAVRNDGISPAVSPWRSLLAVLTADEDPDEARRLVADELAEARRIELPRAVGVALRARAALEHGRAREQTLGEAVAVLRDSPARLELVRALIDLGAERRRRGRRAAAREPLREALELAHRCGAESLIAVAEDELRAADGRPRSPWLTGAAALTPSELRVARLAASGLSNQQIAEGLFVTTKTVEMHLTNAYRKLGSSSRAQLGRLLETELDPR